MNRKSFLRKGIAGSGILLFPSIIIAQEQQTFSSEEISEFVGAAHRDFDETKRIIESKPLILNCANQRIRGDFETALGGASHVGQREIADLLISKGARIDIFNHAFLGHADLVIRLVKSYPQLLNSPGPHGFTLLHHAKVGKNQVLEEWLIAEGLIETHFKGVFG